MKKLTPWFAKSDYPVRNGVYLTRFFDYPTDWDGYSYWNMGKWCIAAETPKEALINAGHKSAMQNRQWLGLSEEPTA
jgi:hypothetical protein